MKALRFHAVGDLRCESVPISEPVGEEILLQVSACGICGSDLPRAFALGTKVAPVTLGHEFFGRICRVGDPKNADLIGRRAAVYNVIPCMQCRYCHHGDYAHCEQISYLGTRKDGGFAEYCLVPSRFQLVMLPESDVPDYAFALTEPAAVALHALRLAAPAAGSRLLVIGAGPIGLLCAKWAKLLGVQTVVLTDISEEKIRFARSLGFSACLSKQEEITAILGHLGADVVIEGSGSSAGLQTAIDALNTFGKVILLGNAHSDIVISQQHFSMLQRKEAQFFASWNSYYCEEPLNEWAYVLKMIAERKLVVDDLVTHRFRLEELPEQFERIYRKELSVCKAVYDATLS